MTFLTSLCGLFLVLACTHGAYMPKKVGRCVVPQPPLFGSIRIVDRGIRYSCRAGFRLLGGKKISKCVEKKTGGVKSFGWDGRARWCEYKTHLGFCPKINNPINGFVDVSNYSKGGVASFECRGGYSLVGVRHVRCLISRRWSTDFPVCQNVHPTYKEFANILKDKFIDKYGMNRANSNLDLQAKVNVGKPGSELVFAIDTSTSIGPDSLNIAKDFVKTICGKFNISKDSSGGKYGTRIAVLTFSQSTEIVFNLHDPNVRSLDKVNKKIDEIKEAGGGTNFNRLMETIKSAIILRNFGKRTTKDDPIARERKENANKALFIITDGGEVFNEKGKKKMKLWRSMITEIIKRDGFEIFTIGIGKPHVSNSLLRELASTPHYEHVFQLKDIEHFNEIVNIISGEGVDFGMCGISGNTNTQHGGYSNKGAWPWLGWLSGFQNSEKIISCGGALLCDKWFITLASCVTEDLGLKFVVMRGGKPSNYGDMQINLYLGDLDNSKSDDSELMFMVKKIHVHPDYTGDRNEYGVTPYDIALLELGFNKETTPKLNARVRPLCFPELGDLNRQPELSLYKSKDNNLTVEVAGWGHMGTQKMSVPKALPRKSMMQLKQSILEDKICKRRYPGLDKDMFICVGRLDMPEVDLCYGDTGGPLMVKTDVQRYSFLGLAQKTGSCNKLHQFSIFINVLHPVINKWVKKLLRGCNRINGPVPYVEEEVEQPENGGDADGKPGAEEAGSNEDANRDDDDDGDVAEGETDDNDKEERRKKDRLQAINRMKYA